MCSVQRWTCCQEEGKETKVQEISWWGQKKEEGRSSGREEEGFHSGVAGYSPWVRLPPCSWEYVPRTGWDIGIHPGRTGAWWTGVVTRTWLASTWPNWGGTGLPRMKFWPFTPWRWRGCIHAPHHDNRESVTLPSRWQKTARKWSDSPWEVQKS